MMPYKVWDSIYDFVEEVLANAPSANIIEVGAHTGTDTSHLSSYVKEGRMLAFEPDPRNIAVLKERMSGSKVEIMGTAVGAVSGYATLHMSSGENPQDGSDHTASSSLLPPKNHLEKFPWVKFERQAEVEVVTLDEAWSGGVVDFVWADIQGAEIDMIKGGQAVLNRTKFLFTEFNDGEMYEGQQGLDAILEALPGEWGIVRIFGDEILLQNKAFGKEYIKPEGPLSIVMQGPVDQHTQASIASVRGCFPRAELILSTWAGANVDDLDVDEVAWVEDPGPGSEEAYLVLRGNLSRMIVGCHAGIVKASNSLVMKIRPDTIFTGNDCLRHVGRWPKRSENMRVFSDRIIVPNIGTADPDVHICFQVSDWVMLGQKEDLLEIFSAPLTQTPPVSPEQYIWHHAISKKVEVPGLGSTDEKTPELVKATKDFMANNLVILDTRAQYQFRGGRYPDLGDDHPVNMRHSKWAQWYGRML